MTWPEFPDGLIDRLLLTIDEREASILRCVCHSWNEAFTGTRLWERSRFQFDEKFRRRSEKRRALTDSLREQLDCQLSDIVGIKVENYDYYDWVEAKEEIVQLLDLGATLSKLDCNKLRCPNLGDLVDMIERNQPCTRRRFSFYHQNEKRVINILSVVDEITASPCKSTLTHKRYTGLGREILPDFIIRFALYGDVWGKPVSEGDIEQRYAAWCSFRWMLYREECMDPEVKPENSIIYWAAHCIELRHFLEKHKVSCRSKLLNQIIKEIEDEKDGKWIRTVIEAEQISKSIVYRHDVIPKLVSSLIVAAPEHAWELFNKFSSLEHVSEYTIFQQAISMINRNRRYMLRVLRESANWRKVFMQNELLVHEFCRRKERKTFGMLLRLEPEAMRSTVVPKALELLKKTNPLTVRGKKERLIELLENFQNEISDSESDC